MFDVLRIGWQSCKVVVQQQHSSSSGRGSKSVPGGFVRRAANSQVTAELRMLALLAFSHQLHSRAKGKGGQGRAEQSMHEQ